MKPTTDAVGCVVGCTPRDLQKLAHLATRVIMNRTIPNGKGTLRRLWPVMPQPAPSWRDR